MKQDNGKRRAVKVQKGGYEVPIKPPPKIDIRTLAVSADMALFFYHVSSLLSHVYTYTYVYSHVQVNLHGPAPVAYTFICTRVLLVRAFGTRRTLSLGFLHGSLSKRVTSVWPRTQRARVGGGGVSMCKTVCDKLQQLIL